MQFQNYKRPTLTISKVDINGRFLTGAIFEVKTKAGVKIGDFPVGPDGKITVPNIHLDEGYYIIREIQAPEGYILDSTPHELVERIDVYHTQGKGKNRTQRIVIHYNFIGVLDMPEVEEYPDNIVLDSRQGVAVEYLVGKAG